MDAKHLTRKPLVLSGPVLILVAALFNIRSSTKADLVDFGNHNQKILEDASQEWKLKREVDNIKVYYRKPSDSKILEIKTVATSQATMGEVLSVLGKVRDFPEWVYHCENAYWLNRSTDTSGIYYCEIGFPWPIRNRDFIAKTTLHQNEKTKAVQVDITGLPGYLPKKDNIVRIPELVIDWRITPLAGSRTRLEYRLHTDPGGALPAWLINLAIHQGPLQSMQGLLEKIQEKG